MNQKTIRPLIVLPAVFMLQLFLVPPSPAAAEAPACGELVKSKCIKCHHETRICQKVRKGKGKGSWKTTIKSMIRHGAVVNKDEKKQLVTCLSTPDSEVLELCGIKE